MQIEITPFLRYHIKPGTDVEWAQVIQQFFDFTTAKACSMPPPSCGPQSWLVNLVRGGNTQNPDAQNSEILPDPVNSVP